MKLSKTIILSGILFSSVLGSINVNSITALAADASQAGANETISNANKKVKVVFVNSSGKEIDGISTTTTTLDNKGKVILSSISVENYTVVSNQDPEVINDSVNIKVTPSTPSTPSTPGTPGTPSTSGKPGHTSKPARYTVQRVRITYVNKATKEQVGYLQLIGKDSFSKKITAPEGYVFLNEKDATVKFDKKGNKDINVYVKQMTAAPVKHEGTVTTSNGQYKLLFNLDGKAVKNRALSANSSWHTDQYAVINGEKMYRVATNEWVKASDIL